MVSLLCLLALYFLPSIIGRDKPHAMSIFLLNFFLGWTVVGWIVAFIWACAPDRPAYVHYVPVSAGHYCSRCGALAPGGAHFCTGCGRTV